MASSDYVSALALVPTPARSLFQYSPPPLSLNLITQVPIPTSPQSTHEISPIFPSHGDVGVAFGASLLSILSGSADCSIVILYFTANIHLGVGMYHACLLVFLSLGFFTQYNFSSFIHVPANIIMPLF